MFISSNYWKNILVYLEFTAALSNNVFTSQSLLGWWCCGQSNYIASFPALADQMFFYCFQMCSAKLVKLLMKFFYDFSLRQSSLSCPFISIWKIGYIATIVIRKTCRLCSILLFYLAALLLFSQHSFFSFP